MKSELEQCDLEFIANTLLEKLKPLFSTIGKKDDDDRLMDVKNLADYLKLTKEFVYKKAEANEIPHIRVGNRLRFRKKDIEKWLEQYRVPSVN